MQVLKVFACEGEGGGGVGKEREQGRGTYTYIHIHARDDNLPTRRTQEPRRAPAPCVQPAHMAQLDLRPLLLPSALHVHRARTLKQRPRRVNRVLSGRTKLPRSA